MWYEKAYKRHLCDMHIENWNDEFLRDFSPETYAKLIIDAGFQCAMVYLQSHVGYCYYPTKVGEMHRAFIGREDAMKTVIETLRKNNVAVVGYYSLIYNSVEHDKHPEWRLLKSNGKSERSDKAECDKDAGYAFSEAKASRYGKCCPNNPDYRSFTVEQIKEMSEYTEFDGMFYDMTFWPHMCYCEHCKDRWKKEVGGEMPVEPKKGSDEWRLLMKKHTEWIDEFAMYITNITKEIMPNVTVAHNVAFSGLNEAYTCNSVGVHNASDYSGGDVADTIYTQSFVCKFYKSITKNKPFEHMIYRCEPSLAKHTTLKSKDVMATAVMLTAAHHGATLAIDAIDPCGTLDSRVYDRFRETFDMEEVYEPYFTGEMQTDVGLYYSTDGKYNKYSDNFSNYTCVTELVRTMIEGNICAAVTGGYDKKDLSRFRMIFAPSLTQNDACDNERLAKYVEDGGILYLSGADNPELTEKLLGAKVTGITEETITYMSPCVGTDIFEYFNKKYPINFDAPAALIEGVDKASVWATLTLPYTKQNEFRYASIHSNPPGIYTDLPALVVKSYGKGKVVWSAQPIESAPFEVYRIILTNLTKKLLGEDSLLVLTDAPRIVEFTVFEDTNCKMFNVVHLNTDYYANMISSFNAAVKCEKAPTKVELLPNGEEIDFSYENGYVKFKVRDFKIFDMYRICF